MSFFEGRMTQKSLSRFVRAYLVLFWPWDSKRNNDTGIDTGIDTVGDTDTDADVDTDMYLN